MCFCTIFKVTYLTLFLLILTFSEIIISSLREMNDSVSLVLINVPNLGNENNCNYKENLSLHLVQEILYISDKLGST